MEQLTGLKAILHSKRANVYYLERRKTLELCRDETHSYRYEFLSRLCGGEHLNLRL
jgi:hypothetical protein